MSFSIQFSVGTTPLTTPYAVPFNPFDARPSLARDLSVLWATNQQLIYSKPIIGIQRAPSDKYVGSYKYGSPGAPLGANGPLDLLRASGFLSAGAGISFGSKNSQLQASIAFTETRNNATPTPTAMISAGLSLGNNLNIGIGGVIGSGAAGVTGGVSGIFGNLVGGVSIGTTPDATFLTPPGSVATALPSVLSSTGTKGLLRAPTANSGLDNLQTIWGAKQKASPSYNSTANTVPYSQKGIVARSDEGAYGLMLSGGTKKFSYGDNRIPFLQRWVGGTSAAMRKKKEYPTSAGRLFTDEQGGIIIFQDVLMSENLPNSSINVGIDMTTQDKSQPVKYGNVYGKDFDGSGRGSDIMMQQNYYMNAGRKYPTKRTDQKSIDALNTNLKRALQDIRDANDGNTYLVNVPSEASVISSGQATKAGYDRLMSRTNGQAGQSKLFIGALADYRGVQGVLDYTSTDQPDKRSKGFPTNGNADLINRMTVLDGAGAKVDQGEYAVTIMTMDKSGKRVVSGIPRRFSYQPYYDDQIAFFFYDVVNDKYIPFRATMKNVSENGNASWEELPFIGRGDKVYSYGGFNRNLSFTFHIAVSSILELAPTFNRLNYLTTLIKPANYTFAQVNQSFNRFMVPPMVFLTIGDLYKDQPILIQSITTNVPDEAIWETTNEFNSKQWEYLASYITSPNIVYGQLPRSIDVQLSLILLEKERAVVGGANFGHAPRQTDSSGNWKEWNTDTPKGASPNTFHKSLVVNVIDSCNGKGCSGTQTQTQEVKKDTPFNILSAPPLVPVDKQFEVPITNVNTNNAAPYFPVTSNSSAAQAPPLTSQLQPSSNKQLSDPASIEEKVQEAQRAWNLRQWINSPAQGPTTTEFNKLSPESQANFLKGVPYSKWADQNEASAMKRIGSQ